jgi:hypothetical protein
LFGNNNNSNNNNNNDNNNHNNNNYYYKKAAALVPPTPFEGAEALAGFWVGLQEVEMGCMVCERRKPRMQSLHPSFLVYKRSILAGPR